MKNPKLKSWFVVLLSMLLLSGIGHHAIAQQVTQTVISQIDPSGFPGIELYVDIFDSLGNPVPDLEASDFCVKQDGEAVPFQVTEIGVEYPISVCLVIDRSGSMAWYGTPKYISSGTVPVTGDWVKIDSFYIDASVTTFDVLLKYVNGSEWAYLKIKSPSGIWYGYGYTPNIWPPDYVNNTYVNFSGFSEYIGIYDNATVEEGTWEVYAYATIPQEYQLIVQVPPIRIEAVKTAAHRFVNNMGVYDRVAIVSYSSNEGGAECVTVDQNFTSNTVDLHNAINGISAVGGTAMFDAFWIGVDITCAEAGSKAMIGFSNGGENSSQSCPYPPDGIYEPEGFTDDCDTVSAYANNCGMPIYSIGFGAEAWEDPLRCAAENTGGYYRLAPSGAAMDSIYTDIKGTLLARYVIVYTSPDTTSNGDVHEVIVCEGGVNCFPCDTAYYTEPCPPIIVRTPETIQLSSTCQPYGQNLVIRAQVTDPCPPGITKVSLFYRVTGSGSSYTEVIMNPVGGDIYQAVIPDAQIPIGTPGIDYYLTATDGQSTVSDPPNYAHLFPYQISICPNEAPVITHTPVDCGPTGDPVTITAMITDVTDYVAHATLFYRKGGTILYDSIGMTNVSGSTYEGVIPGSYMDATGADYYIIAMDNYGLMTYHGASTSPHHIDICAGVISAKVAVLPTTWYTTWGTPHTGRIRCWIGELTGGYDVSQINRSTLRLNGTVPMYGTTYRIISSWPGFTGLVLEMAFDRYSSYLSLGPVIPGQQYPIEITGKLNNGVDFSGETMVIVQTALPKLIGEAEIPESFSLIQNYPNPFNPETDIEYALPTDCQVKLSIYNLLGQKVKTLVNEPQTAGFKTIHWNGRDEQGNLVASGIYFYKLNAGDFTATKKMVMTK